MLITNITFMTTNTRLKERKKYIYIINFIDTYTFIKAN